MIFGDCPICGDLQLLGLLDGEACEACLAKDAGEEEFGPFKGGSLDEAIERRGEQDDV